MSRTVIAPLETTTRYHIDIGSSHRWSKDPAHLDTPGHSFMTDEELTQKITTDTQRLREFLTKNDATSRWLEFWDELRNQMFFPNLYYLSAIGRLPADIDIAELEKHLPAKP